MTETSFRKVASYQDLAQAQADFLNSGERGFGTEVFERLMEAGVKKLMELSRKTVDANEDFFYEQLRANRGEVPIADCLLITEEGKPAGIWRPTDIPPPYKRMIFESAYAHQLFHLIYRRKQQLFFLEEDREEMKEVTGDSEVWTYGNLGNSRGDAVCSAFVQNTGRFGHLGNRYVMGELNHHQNRDTRERVPGIRINNFPGFDKPVVITPYDQIEMALARAETMAEKHGWRRIEIDRKAYPDLYKHFVLAAFHAYLEETGYAQPAVFWHLPNDRSVDG